MSKYLRQKLQPLLCQRLVSGLLCGLVLCLSLIQAKGQSVNVSIGGEKTATRFLYGGGLMFENKNKWGIGATYEMSLFHKADEGLTMENFFYGLAFQLPIARSQKIDVFVTTRLGLINEDFFVLLPGLETRIKTWRKLSTVFCMGYRVGYPSVGFKLSHPVFQR